MAWNFSSIIYGTNYDLLTDALLPFALIFTIVYSVLQKTKILGTEDDGKTPKKNFNVVLSLIMSMAVVIPHITRAYPNQWDVVTIINNFIPNVALVAVVVIMLLLILGLSGKPADFTKEGLGGGFTLFGIIIIGIIFLAAADVFNRAFFPRWLYFIYDQNFQALIVTLIVFGLIIGYITKDEKKDKDKGENILKTLNAFGK
ncbi:hypothetical protein K9L67_00555 [Candidatus Woesearchaeota archaeon]|nr:hypothetical protein [Candidatus Woesearchaeota archaeon]MCF7900697.1 hypothetical protein [Candidatus Woesearchaeota archaeon]MCF8013218.1 hypothetical protein [Candidatus Woesearchaeota archaeon]